VGIDEKFASLVATAGRRVLSRLGQRDELIMKGFSKMRISRTSGDEHHCDAH